MDGARILTVHIYLLAIGILFWVLFFYFLTVSIYLPTSVKKYAHIYLQTPSCWLFELSYLSILLPGFTFPRPRPQQHAEKMIAAPLTLHWVLALKLMCEAYTHHSALTLLSSWRQGADNSSMRQLWYVARACRPHKHRQLPLLVHAHRRILIYEYMTRHIPPETL